MNQTCYLEVVMKKVKKIIRTDFILFLVMGLLVLYGCGDNKNSSDETESEEVSNMISVNIFDNTYTIPESWLVEEVEATGNVKEKFIYFESPKPKEFENVVTMLLFTDVLSDGDENSSYSVSEDVIDQLFPYLLPSIFPNENDQKNCTTCDYNLKESAGLYIEGTNTEANYETECYVFFNNFKDILLIQYNHMPSSKRNYSSNVKEMVDSIVFSYPGFIKEAQGQTSFTNKFGTPTTKCAHAGCNNFIASSGDTNCCEEHSNKCAKCGKYIDEDAMYCMDCLEAEISD